MIASEHVKKEGKDNDLLTLLADDPDFPLSEDRLGDLMNPAKYIGLADRQVERFIAQEVKPVLDANQDAIKTQAKIEV